MANELSIEQQLYDLMKDPRDIDKVKELMKNHPEVNVNWSNPKEVNLWTPLHRAVHRRNDKGLALLLAHPKVNVNVRDNAQGTPFELSCMYKALECAKILLADNRVDPNAVAAVGYMPLDSALWVDTEQELAIFKWWLASGREMKPGRYSTVLPENHGESAIVKQFKTDVMAARRSIRLELGWHDQVVAEYFAVIIFLCDGLLDIHETGDARREDIRFFKIVRRLPIELQMCVCHRLIGSMSCNISGRTREAAFFQLACDLKLAPK